MTGRAFLHHFGSITQKSIRAKTGQPRKSMGDREYYRRKTGQTLAPPQGCIKSHTAVRSAWWKRTELGAVRAYLARSQPWSNAEIPVMGARFNINAAW